jgi:hypothetical protein
MFHVFFYFIEKYADTKCIKKQENHVHFKGRQNPLDMPHCDVKNN